MHLNLIVVPRFLLQACMLCVLAFAGCTGETSPSDALDDEPHGGEGGGGGDDHMNGGGGGEAQGEPATDARPASGSDAVGDDGQPPSETKTDAASIPPLPAGNVAMFVAAGVGGRRIMSCDGGKTWLADVSVAPASQDNEHRSYTPKGLTNGNGTFVFLSGWGTNSTAWVSHDGISWTEKVQATSFGGPGFDDGRFVLVGNRYIAASNDAGASWMRLDVPHSIHDRDAAAFSGVWAAGSDGKVVVRRGSGGWQMVSGCSGSRHGGIGQSGGFAAGLGLLVSVGGDGNTCGVNIATGAALPAGRINATVRGKPAFLGDAFWVATGNSIFTSTNGSSWSSRALPQGVAFELVAKDSSGAYAGVARNGKDFFYSADGTTWQRASAPAGNALYYLVGGSGKASERCPAK